jgi:hypothetical protein
MIRRKTETPARQARSQRNRNQYARRVAAQEEERERCEVDAAASRGRSDGIRQERERLTSLVRTERGLGRYHLTLLQDEPQPVRRRVPIPGPRVAGLYEHRSPFSVPEYEFVAVAELEPERKVLVIQEPDDYRDRPGLMVIWWDWRRVR